jgi:hypothetical protein
MGRALAHAVLVHQPGETRGNVGRCSRGADRSGGRMSSIADLTGQAAKSAAATPFVGSERQTRMVPSAPPAVSRSVWPEPVPQPPSADAATVALVARALGEGNESLCRWMRLPLMGDGVAVGIDDWRSPSGCSHGTGRS